MNLTEAQKLKINGWIAEGLKLSEIQRRLETEFALRITYMEARLLLDDLKLVPKDQAPPPTATNIGGAPAAPAAPAAGPSGPLAPGPGPSPATGPGQVRVELDHVTKPGTMVSGSVTFSDGQNAAWYLDQMGRLGLAPQKQGYRPSPQDLEDFQIEVQNELQRLGM